MDEAVDSRDAAIKSNLGSSMKSVKSDLAHLADQDDGSESAGFSRLKRHHSSPEGPEEAVQPHGSAKKQKLGAVPRVNWNAGTKANIRTSLKGGDSTYNQKVEDGGRQTAGQSKNKTSKLRGNIID